VGTVGVVLDDTGAAAETVVRDAWGNLLAGSSSERYGFAQREHDSESGLVYMRARMYDPRVGRFTQTDPLVGNRPAEHYTYAANNPVSKTDPMGLDVTEDDWNTFNSMMAQLKAYQAAGESALYNRVKSNLYDFTTRLYREQGWLEVRDQQTALSMVARVSALPDMGIPDAEVVKGDLAAAGRLRSAVEDKVWKLEATQTGLRVAEVAGTAAGFALGGGSLIHLAKEGGARLVAAQLVKGVVCAGATEAALKVAGEAAVAGGANPEWVAEAKQGARAVVNLVNLGRVARADRQVWDRAQAIGRGHAYRKHVLGRKEYPEIESEEEFARLAYKIMRRPTAIRRDLGGGRTMFWHDPTRTVVIHNPADPDLGTMFPPHRGRAYFEARD
jgi:RHS repeat-associated protein